jgi:hypothetical protein
MVAKAKKRITLDDLTRHFEESRKDFDKRLGELSNRIGDVTEYSFVPDALMQRFIELGYDLDVHARDFKVKDEKRQVVAEFDMMFQNCNDLIVVEIKTKLLERHIDDLIERIKKVKPLNFFKDKKISGAVAGAVITDNVKVYAMKHGLFVVEETGENVIVLSDNKFKPQKW